MEQHRKKLLVISLVVILVTSTLVTVIIILPHPFTESLDNTDHTKFVADVFQAMPMQCYIVYTNPQFKNDQSTSVRIYNDTKNSLVEKFGDKVYDFLGMPETKLYLFNHCGFFNNSISQIPNKYDQALGVINSTVINFEKMRQEQQVKYDFKTRAMSENRIENLAAFYFLTYDEVVAKLFDYGLLSEKQDCYQVPHAHTGVLQCQWKQSTFAFYNTTGSVAILPDNYGKKPIPQSPSA